VSATAPPEELADAVERAVAPLGAVVRRRHPLGPLTTYKVGGAAEVFVEVASPEQLVALAGALRGTGAPVLVVGRGSNLLVSDRGFPGVALQLGEELAGIDVHDDGADEAVLVAAGGAASLPVVARRTVAAGLTGFEWAVGVPGSIGGAVRMNAGGHGSDMAAVLRRVRLVDLSTGEDVEVDAERLDLGYRRSSIRQHQVVVRADLALRRGDPERGRAELAEIVRWRREHQPGGQNAGSVFTNPPGDSAGRLVEASGCKGLRVGTAEVSTKHANFIQADPGGSAEDVLAVMREVIARVERTQGVTLHPETVLVGFDDPDRTSQ